MKKYLNLDQAIDAIMRGETTEEYKKRQDKIDVLQTNVMT